MAKISVHKAISPSAAAISSRRSNRSAQTPAEAR